MSEHDKNSTQREERPESEQSAFWEYWLLLRKRWALIAFIFALFLLGGIFYTARQPKMYQATATLSITPPYPRRIGHIEVDQGATYYPWDKSYLNTQMEILKSRSMGQKVVERMPQSLSMSLFGREREHIGSGSVLGCLSVANKRDTDIVSITCSARRPEDCAALANLIAEVFIEEMRKDVEDSQSMVLTWLKDETPKVRDSMLNQRKALLEFEKENPEVSFICREKGGTMMDMLGRLRQELQDVNIQLAAAELAYEKCQKVREKAMAAAMVTALAAIAAARENPEISALDALLTLDFFEENELIQQLRERKFALEDRLEEYRGKYKDEHPKIAQIHQSIRQIDQKILKEAELIIERQEQIYQDLKVRREKLKDMLDTEQKKSLAFQEKYVRYEHDRSEYEASQKTYNSFIDKLKELDSTATYHVNNIEHLDSAEVPSAPFYPNKTRNYLISCLLGLMAGIGLTFLLEFLDQTVKTPEEIQELVAAPVIGFVPFISRKIISGEIGRAVLEKDKSPVAEAFRSISTSLFLSEEKGSRSFLITSPLEREGKSIVACNLALTLARAGHSVLLVDADIRKPRLRSMLQLLKSPGFSELLQGQIGLPEVTQSVIENLWCIPAGKVPADVYESIMKSQLENIVKIMKETYQYVIIDSPPVGLTNDAFLLGKATDALLFLVSLQRSHKRMLKQLAQRLKSLEIPVKGVIVNDTKGDRSAMLSYYSYYGPYYYRSYYGPKGEFSLKF